MSTAATIIIPTHNHAQLLYASVASALAQTIKDIEVFIVGDGVPDVTREIVLDLKRDTRVTFFDHPKGERHGETYRSDALRQAQGAIVCYLCDDDLFFPNHVEVMLDLLKSADFVNALPITVNKEGVRVYAVDLGNESVRQLVTQIRYCRFGLSAMAHTLEFYKGLPFGWRTTPDNIPTDQYMFQQCLSAAGVRATSSFRPTVLNFPDVSRKTLPITDRLQELEAWLARLQDDQWRSAFEDELLSAALKTSAEELANLTYFQQVYEDSQRLASDTLELAKRWEESANTQKAVAQSWEQQAIRLEHELAALRNSKTWKLRQRLRRILGAK